eukprot:TRINITY_DN104133_c0_g1_i1.p1 TRINITY_DN104133_c0_g1~~TRINITY_DN104133_c0_g1_i1.p1  ORF type:complete len:392 (-),score=53.62 TRINITY_DN104133_c0_g1_i1:31-1206(-)
MLPSPCDVSDLATSEPASGRPASSYAWAEKRLSQAAAFAAANWDNPTVLWQKQKQQKIAKLTAERQAKKRQKAAGIAGRRNSMRVTQMCENSPFTGGIFEQEMATSQAVQKIFLRRLKTGTFDDSGTASEGVEASSERPNTAPNDVCEDSGERPMSKTFASSQPRPNTAPSEIREDSGERPMSKTSASSQPLAQPQRPTSQACLRPNSAQASPGAFRQTNQAALHSFSRPQYPDRSMSKTGGFPQTFQCTENGASRPHSAPNELRMNPGSSPSWQAMSSKSQSERESPTEGGSRNTSKGSGLEWVAQRLSKAAAVAASNWDNPKVYQDYVSRERLAKEAERKAEKKRQKLLQASVAALSKRNSLSRDALFERLASAEPSKEGSLRRLLLQN